MLIDRSLVIGVAIVVVVVISSIVGVVGIGGEDYIG